MQEKQYHLRATLSRRLEEKATKSSVNNGNATTVYKSNNTTKLKQEQHLNGTTKSNTKTIMTKFYRQTTIKQHQYIQYIHVNEQKTKNNNKNKKQQR